MQRIRNTRTGKREGHAADPEDAGEDPEHRAEEMRGPCCRSGTVKRIRIALGQMEKEELQQIRDDGTSSTDTTIPTPTTTPPNTTSENFGEGV